MANADFIRYLDAQIELLKAKIKDDKHAITDPNDDVSRGKLSFYNALHEFLRGEPSKFSTGLIGAVNDTFQQLGKIEKDQTLLTLINAPEVKTKSSAEPSVARPPAHTKAKHRQP